eukprot:6589784-Prymnesium_polylepis.3
MQHAAGERSLPGTCVSQEGPRVCTNLAADGPDGSERQPAVRVEEAMETFADELAGAAGDREGRQQGNRRGAAEELMVKQRSDDPDSRICDASRQHLAQHALNVLPLEMPTAQQGRQLANKGLDLLL